MLVRKDKGGKCDELAALKNATRFTFKVKGCMENLQNARNCGAHSLIRVKFLIRAHDFAPTMLAVPLLDDGQLPPGLRVLHPGMIFRSPFSKIIIAYF